MTTHYVASIKIEKIELSESRSSSGEKRRVGEVTRLIVKASSLEDLKRRITQHTTLIEDDVPLDTINVSNTR